MGTYAWRAYENSKQRPLAIVCMKLDARRTQVSEPFIHASADVSKNIGKNTRIWQYVVVFPDAVIGDGGNV